ncbi:hypothetical protein [Sulfurospirillum sp. 1612]|uniref:hypothetical protein n=1 Tax=Sulfurospirillum sp. 1612 TaxID=3094835 RepID=UPI002F93972A
MDNRILDFIDHHHVLSCAFCSEEEIYSASCFYAFLDEPARFIIASKGESKHIAMVSKNHHVAGTIHLETQEIGKIQGVQFQGIWRKARMKESQAYLLRFPYASVMVPKLWCIEISYIKFTDNRFGFGEKLEFSTK